jgi:hypothetical protein
MIALFEQHPCVVEFWLDIAFPAGVLGPVDDPARSSSGAGSLCKSDIGLPGPSMPLWPIGNARQILLSS